MSRFQKLSHVLWYCQYHIVFVPKYRFRILKGDLGKYVYKSLYAHTERAGCEVVELNVQPDHVLCGAPHKKCYVKFPIMLER
jgi:putative transposase